MRIFMTGGTSGIGQVAARRLLDQDGVDLLLAARRPQAAPADVGRATLVAMDLADLASVRQGADQVLAGPPLDALVLNAGLQVQTAQKTRDGFETTFAVNHLAHYLLLRMLLPHLAPNARVILTASGTHNPDEKTGMPAPYHANAQWLAFPETDPQRDPKPAQAGRRAYSTSKLCNVMTAREAVVRTAQARPDLTILAFDPGFTPGTGLAREYPAALRFVFRRILPHLPILGARQSTPDISGRYLADLALGVSAVESGAYMAVHGKRLIAKAPSALAQDAEKAAALWNDSAQLTGLLP
ncbi:MAG: SDR family NAD(P)-dependent oxidoreductase [Elstera sp.]